MDPRRLSAVQWATREQAEFGNHPRLALYWTTVGLSATSHGQWCGVFALAALDIAGIPAGEWRIGSGFIYRDHLPPIDRPEPGDILYRNEPWRHHGLVACVEGDTVHTIEGNTPGISCHGHDLDAPGIVYYSIARLVGGE